MGHTKMRKYTRKVVIEEKEYKDLKRDRKILFRIKSDKK
jgi:cold shock CspA family protein